MEIIAKNEKGYVPSNTPMTDAVDKLFSLSFHEGLKVFGSWMNISSLLDEKSEKEGFIKHYKNLKNIPKLPQGSSIIHCGDGSATIYFPESKMKYNKIKNIENKWNVRDLIKQGYIRI